MTKRAPDQSFRIGFIKASVWLNQTKVGERANVSVCRLFKNGDQWVESSIFNRDDLLVLAKVVDQAHTWITSSKKGVDSNES